MRVDCEMHTQVWKAERRGGIAWLRRGSARRTGFDRICAIDCNTRPTPPKGPVSQDSCFCVFSFSVPESDSCATPHAPPLTNRATAMSYPEPPLPLPHHSPTLLFSHVLANLKAHQGVRSACDPQWGTLDNLHVGRTYCSNQWEYFEYMGSNTDTV